MTPATTVGLIAVLAAIALALGGWYLTRQYGMAVRYRGIGRPYPLWQSALAFLGYVLSALAVASAFVAVMLLFF